jgi:hypothetical protein
VKKLGMIGIPLMLLIIIVAAVTAGKMGETSHAFAKGKVILDDSLKEQAKGIRTLFIIARGADRPMPIGALKTTLRSDPEGEVYDFVLTKDNMQLMGGGMGGGEFPPEFKLKARLDTQGVGGMDKPGDLTGEVDGVHLGQEGIEIRINHRVE